MKIRPAFFILCSLAALSAPNRAGARDTQGRFGAGLNWPGVSVRYGASRSLTLECRYQTEDNIGVFGPRMYVLLRDYGKLNLFTGAEADYVAFTGQSSQGTGFACELFAGGEYFIDGNLSFQFDIGPAWLNITDRDTSLSAYGMDTVVNMGFNYYFGNGENADKNQ